MASIPGQISPNFIQTNQSGNKNYNSALSLLTTLFFMWGLITCMNDILIPHLKSIFDMDYTQTMLIQFTFFGAYALMSVPASMIIGKIGYQKGIVLGLIIAGLGAFLFYPASVVLAYPLFLFAFFTLATGITVLQVAANPYVAILGAPETASSRLTLTQAFNSLGTTIAPIIGSLLILGGMFYSINDDGNRVFNPTKDQIVHFDDAKWKEFDQKDKVAAMPINAIMKDKTNHIWFQDSLGLTKFDGVKLESYQHVNGKLSEETQGILVTERSEHQPFEQIDLVRKADFPAFQKEKAKTVQIPYIALGLILLVIALVFWFVKLPVISSARPSSSTTGSVWQYRHLVLGAIGIFVYVGAEVSIGSFLVNFFGERDIAGLSEKEAAKFVALYWGGAMIGRFQGAIAMSKITSKIKQYGTLILILLFGFLLSLYITKEIDKALIFLLFIVINAIASIFGKNKPSRTLAIFAGFAMLFVILTLVSGGYLALWAIVAVGLFNSIMFPTIFTLAIDGLGEHTSQGSGILNTAIVGGAIIPLIMGAFADGIGIHHAFIITLVCYAFIFFYAINGYKHKSKPVNS